MAFTPYSDAKLKFPTNDAGGGPAVGGTRQRRFAGTNLKPHKLLENAQSPTTIVPVLFRGSGARGV